MATQGAQGSQAILGSKEAVFGAIFFNFIKRISSLQASLNWS